MNMQKAVAVDNASFLADQVIQLEEFVRESARTGRTMAEFEMQLLRSMVAIGRQCTDEFLRRQGDLGPTLDMGKGVLQRSAEPRPREVRTLFGEHCFHASVYGQHLDRKIDFRPIDARLQLDASKYSPRFQEISQLLATEQAFGQAAKTLEAIFGQSIAVHSLERINQKLGDEAEEFLFTLPIPAAQDEGEILVVSGDGKGIPMIREQVGATPAFEKRAHPGNRKMATLATVYSIDPFVRTPEQIVEALFRDSKEEKPSPRPEPIGKVVVGYWASIIDDNESMPGEIPAFTWAAEQVERRHRRGQPLVRVMDGQASLWNTSLLCLEDRATIDILDIIHVSSYVWSAAKIFHGQREHQEAFTRDRLERILHGNVSSVIADWCRRARRSKLKKQDRNRIQRICGYLSKNKYRMRYDEYLRKGYPIASGVIEGACRHLVMDRMCCSGMRWQPPSSQAMLHVRAVYQAGIEADFYTYRAKQKREKPINYAACSRTMNRLSFTDDGLHPVRIT